MDSRAKKLIEALGFEWAQNQTPITHEELLKRASVEYDKLAEQAQHCLDVSHRAKGLFTGEQSQMWSQFTKNAAELRAMIPKEPTLLDKLEAERVAYKRFSSDTFAIDAVIELYRDYLKRQGKE